MNHDSIYVTGFRPGALGRVVEMHGDHYARAWGLDVRFEAEVAREMGEFMARFDAGRDGFWLALEDGRIVGSITLDASREAERQGRIRWFIVDDAVQGRGVGRRLLDEALGFARARGLRGLYLWTFAGLEAARRLYERRGFTLAEERFERDWSRDGVTHQRLVLALDPAGAGPPDRAS